MEGVFAVPRSTVGQNRLPGRGIGFVRNPESSPRKVIVGPHVTEEPDEATLVELDEFLGQTNFVQIFAFEEVIDEVISRTPMICSSTRVSR